MLSKSLIQFSVDGRDCVLSLLFDLRPNFGGGNEGDVDSLLPSGPLPCLPRPPPESWTLTGKSGLVSCGITAPFPWVLVCTRFFFVPSKGPFLESCVSSGGSVVGLMVTSSKKAYAAPVCCGRVWLIYKNVRKPPRKFGNFIFLFFCKIIRISHLLF